MADRQVRLDSSCLTFFRNGLGVSQMSTAPFLCIYKGLSFLQLVIALPGSLDRGLSGGFAGSVEEFFDSSV